MESFTIGGVVRRAVHLFATHAGLLLLLAVLLVGVPQLATYAILLGGAGRESLSSLPGVFGFVGGVLMQGAVIRTAVEDASGRQTTLGSALGTAARLFFPVLVIQLLSYIAMVLGSMLLLVPGIMLACRWMVVVAVEVAERPGIFASFRRSAELTRGFRWRIFGLFAIFILIWFGIIFGFGFIGGLFGGLAHIKWPVLVANGVVGILAALIGNLGSVATYLELRTAKEGALSDGLASVFD